MGEKCIACGRFISWKPGVSRAQTWSYDMGGTPNLHDPHFQRASCTEKHGALGTNCYHPERYSGVYTADDFASEVSHDQ